MVGIIMKISIIIAVAFAVLVVGAGIAQDDAKQKKLEQEYLELQKEIDAIKNALTPGSGDPTEYLAKDDTDYVRRTAIQIGLVRPDNLEEAEHRLNFVIGRYDVKLAECEKIIYKNTLGYQLESGQCKSELDLVHKELIETVYEIICLDRLGLYTEESKQEACLYEPYP